MLIFDKKKCNSVIYEFVIICVYIGYNNCEELRS